MYKVEKLPENTLIDSKERGLWLKNDKNCWDELYPHCGDCGETVSEEGCDNPTSYQPGITVREKAQEYLGEFEILAAPVGWVYEEDIACRIPHHRQQVSDDGKTFHCLDCAETLIY